MWFDYPWVSRSLPLVLLLPQKRCCRFLLWRWMFFLGNYAIQLSFEHYLEQQQWKILQKQPNRKNFLLLLLLLLMRTMMWCQWGGHVEYDMMSKFFKWVITHKRWSKPKTTRKKMHHLLRHVFKHFFPPFCYTTSRLTFT